MPIAATTMTTPGWVGSGCCRRRTAAQTSEPIATSSSKALPNAARIEARFQPQVWRVVRGEPAGEGAGPGQHQAEHVAEVVAGVGEQRQRIDAPAGDRLDRDEGDVDADADREGAVVPGRAVGVAAWACAVGVVALGRRARGRRVGGDRARGGSWQRLLPRQPASRARIAAITAR